MKMKKAQNHKTVMTMILSKIHQMRQIHRPG